MKNSEVIREARSTPFERGWHQGELESEDGSLCIMGALYGALGSVHNTPVARVLPVYAVLESIVGGAGVGSWNDKYGRTFTEVIDMLDKAEKVAEREEEAVLA